MEYLTDKTLDKTIKKYRYSIKEIMKILFIEHRSITKDECYEKAKIIFKEIKNSNDFINRNTDKYFEHNLPLSIFEDFEDKNNKNKKEDDYSGNELDTD